MTERTRKPGPDSTLDDVRDQLVEAGLELLQERGVEIGLNHLKLSDAIAATGHARATAYRSLADDDLAPQAVLHREVMRRVLVRDARLGNRDLILEAVAEQLELLADHLASDDIARRTYAMRSVIRVGAAVSYIGVSESVTRSVLLASYGALASSPTVDWRHGYLRDGEQNIARLFGEMYTDLSKLFCYRLRSEFTILQFSTAAAATVESMAARRKFSDHLDSLWRPTGLNGELEEWTLHGVAFEAMYTMFFEPEDANDPFADLQNY